MKACTLYMIMIKNHTAFMHEGDLIRTVIGHVMQHESSTASAVGRTAKAVLRDRAGGIIQVVEQERL